MLVAPRSSGMSGLRSIRRRTKLQASPGRSRKAGRRPPASEHRARCDWSLRPALFSSRDGAYPFSGVTRGLDLLHTSRRSAQRAPGAGLGAKGKGRWLRRHTAPLHSRARAPLAPPPHPPAHATSTRISPIHRAPSTRSRAPPSIRHSPTPHIRSPTPPCYPTPLSSPSIRPLLPPPSPAPPSLSALCGDAIARPTHLTSGARAALPRAVSLRLMRQPSSIRPVVGGTHRPAGPSASQERFCKEDGLPGQARQ